MPYSDNEVALPGASATRNPVRSMTGFASVRHETANGELTLSLRCVNHRGLDLHLYVGPEFTIFENEIRALLKTAIRRGHVEVRVSTKRTDNGQSQGYDADALAGYVTAFRRAAAALDLSCQPDLNVLLTLPGVLGSKQPDQPVTENAGPELIAGLTRCAEELNSFREREGEALRSEMQRLARDIQSQTAEIVEVRAEALPAFQTRLREKLGELLADSGVSPARLAEEAAMLADRSDIQEELTRLKTHSAELERLLLAGGEVGKRIDFLLQEMNRETNTTLAKSGNAGEPGLRITSLGLDIKANIERIREQALNLE